MKAIKIKEPTVCPYCGSPVTRILDEGAHLYCTNKNCPEVLVAKLNYFVTKECMNIDGLSEKTIRKIVNSSNVKSWKDLYLLTEDQLHLVCNLGDKTSRKIVKELENSKTEVPAWRVLVSMGIPSIGQIVAKKLLDCYGSINMLHDVCCSNNQKDLAVLENLIGPVAAKNLCNWFNNEQDFYDICDLNLNCFAENSIKDIASNKLQGYTILATGTLENFSRDEIKESVIANGGTYASGVNKKLDFLIVGKDPGAAKVEKANSLDIKQITEEEYLKMIE